MIRSRKAIISEVLDKYQGTVLEVGCTLNSLVDRKDAYGLDVLPMSRDLFCRGDAEFIPFRSKSFDIIVAGELIEHLSDPKRFLEECHRTLTDEGVLIISTPNRKNWVERVSKLNHPAEAKKNFLKMVVTSRQFKKIARYKSIAPPEYEPYRHKQIFDKRELLGLCCGEGIFFCEGFFTSPYFGWNSMFGRIVSGFKCIAHALLPSGLHESMILVLKKGRKN